MIHLVITGQTPSKKTSSQIIFNKKTHKRMIIPNKQYQAWIGGAILQLQAQWGFATPIDRPCEVKTTTYRLTKRKCDLVNLLQAIHDALQAAGVIDDDFLIHSIDGSRRFLGCDKGEERTEIFINIL